VKVAYLVSQYPAPSHTFIRREVAALRRLGLEVDTFSIRRAECQTDDDRAEEARTFYVLAPPWGSVLRDLVATLARRPLRWLVVLGATLRHRLPGPRSLLKSFAYFAEAMHLAAELERRGATHLHNHFANAAANVGLAVTRYLGLGWSLTLHGLGDLSGPTLPLLADKAAACRFVASATRYGVEETRRNVRVADWPKLQVVRCGIEVDRLPAPRRRPPAPGEPLEILSVGRLSPEKAQVGLVEAFAGARDRGLDARLVLVGGGPDEQRIRQAVARRGLSDRVELRGRQPEAAVLESMSRAHLFVLSSLMEGLPVVLMEALGLELPVIAPAITGIPELVAHGETGLLFEAGNWAELTERILTLAGDPAQRLRLATAGRARVMAEFDVARAVSPLAAMFRLANRGVSAGEPAPGAAEQV
jgi:glycosyltransferase involved in cell wall biosynthesis